MSNYLYQCVDIYALVFAIFVSTETFTMSFSLNNWRVDSCFLLFISYLLMAFMEGATKTAKSIKTGAYVSLRVYF